MCWATNRTCGKKVCVKLSNFTLVLVYFTCVTNYLWKIAITVQAKGGRGSGTKCLSQASLPLSNDPIKIIFCILIICISNCRYFRQMAEAVEYIHQMGYIHRDITCQHFLIDYNDVVKLCDFGLTETNRNTCESFTLSYALSNIHILQNNANSRLWLEFYQYSRHCLM